MTQYPNQAPYDPYSWHAQQAAVQAQRAAIARHANRQRNIRAFVIILASTVAIIGLCWMVSAAFL